MMKFRNFLTVFLILNLYFLSFSQNLSKNFTIDDVCSSLTSSKVTSGDFVQEKTSPKLSRPLVSSGNFIISDKGIVWAAQKPFKTSTIITENSITQIGLNGKKQVMISSEGSSNEIFKSVAATLSSLFTGNKAALETYFTISDFSSDSSSWKMDLLPKDKTISSAILKISLGGKIQSQNEQKASLDSMKILQSGESSTSYALSNQKYSQELSDEQKKFFE